MSYINTVTNTEVEADDAVTLSQKSNFDDSILILSFESEPNGAIRLLDGDATICFFFSIP